MVHDPEDRSARTGDAPTAPPPVQQNATAESNDRAAVDQLIEGVAVPRTQPQPLLSAPELRGRVAIVTGGSTGIGRAVALALAGNGVHVAFNYLDDSPAATRSAQKVVQELRELEVRVYSRACDVRDAVDVRAFVGEAIENLGGVHILVNNAGIGRDAAIWRMDDQTWQSVMRTNLDGAFHFIRAVASHMRAQEWGKIVNIASVQGILGDFGLANYISSKAGLIGLTRSAAVELGSRNINVNAVAPGYIRTSRLTERVPAEQLDKARERSVLGRLGDPQDVAGVVLFLCSEAARHITGVVIPVDGGYLVW
jgi:3-oxoacyl-[acyl-carrier protein] reductase